MTETVPEYLARAIQRLMPRDPRWVYWETKDGRCFLYTTEKGGDGKYWSAILIPYGEGARSGRAKVTRWRKSREVHHVKRKDAKARAFRLYRDWRLTLDGKA